MERSGKIGTKAALPQIGRASEACEDGGHEVRYVREPFGSEPDFGAVSVNYRVEDLWERETDPA